MTPAPSGDGPGQVTQRWPRADCSEHRRPRAELPGVWRAHSALSLSPSQKSGGTGGDMCSSLTRGAQPALPPPCPQAFSRLCGLTLGRAGAGGGQESRLLGGVRSCGCKRKRGEGRPRGADLRVVARSGGASDCPPVPPCSVRWDLSSAESEREEVARETEGSAEDPEGAFPAAPSRLLRLGQAEASATGRGGVLARPLRRENQTRGADSAASPRQRGGGRGAGCGPSGLRSEEGLLGEGQVSVTAL